MFSSKLRTKSTEIIDTNTIVLPLSLEDGNDSLPFIQSNPVEIDISYSKEFLFRINFLFEEEENNKYASLEYEIDRNKSSIILILKNITKTMKPIAPPSAIHIATGNKKDKFYLSFMVTSSPYAFQISYTIYRFPEGNK